MESLTHVCMWTDRGWKRITAQVASKLHPGGGVSARSGIFICELCGQYVTLTNSNVYVAHFRHSSAAQEKDCRERSNRLNWLYGGGIYSYRECDRSLPIRIRVESSNYFELELGLTPIPKMFLGNKQNGKIIISLDDSRQYQYDYSRLNLDGVTYLSIGNHPAKKYHISSSRNEEQVHTFWPSEVEGIDGDGTLFSSETGKKIPLGADVEVGKTYFLLMNHGISNECNYISIEQGCEYKENKTYWRVFKVTALEFDKDAACFFLKYHVRLTDRPIKVYPLWPSCIEAPYVIYHKEDKINMFFQGYAVPKVFPNTNMISKGNEAASIISIQCLGRQQLLSVGRNKILEYTYLWKDSLEKIGELPSVQVTDFYGKDFEGGIITSLPEKRVLNILAKFDGEIVIEEPGKLDIRYLLHSDQRFPVDQINYNQKISVIQGLDVVWTCYFDKIKKISRYSERDDKLLKKLQTGRGNQSQISNSIGALAVKMKDYPKSRAWLYKSIRSGYIYEKSLKILKTEFREDEI